jgi:glycosyltransferase involved in cell wall biosynthesis
MGIPAIVTHDCGAKQYVIDGKSGFVVKPNDDEALAKAVLSVTQSVQRSMEMGEFDRSRCRDAISQSTMLRGIKELYTSVLEA